MTFRDLYRLVRKMRKTSPPASFSQIATALGVSKGMSYQIYKGIEPTDHSIRLQLGLSSKCPKCHKKIKPRAQGLRPWVRLIDLTDKQLKYILEHREPLP
jgi:hypothetical protein